jgi:hypothetical protein
MILNIIIQMLGLRLVNYLQKNFSSNLLKRYKEQRLINIMKPLQI